MSYGELAPYAQDVSKSRGRRLAEEPSATRRPYARDRDRILHSTAFRRLNHKTQVFIYHEGDHYRSRLTHSLEVSQIARSIARALRVVEDLTEAVALAHDLGHPPFGHAGERALDAAIADAGGFDHNAQSLRVVTKLERIYGGFDGLNLTWETLEGLVKHNGRCAGEGKPIPEPILDYCAMHDLELDTYSSVEAQIAALADDIAYNAHDIDDGYRADCFTFSDLASIPLAQRHLEALDATYPDIEPARRLYELKRRLITAMVNDLLEETQGRIAALPSQSADAVRGAKRVTVAFSTVMRDELKQLHEFLFDRVYRHPRVMRVMGAAEDIVVELFNRYTHDPGALPPEWREAARGDDPRATARHVADFIAGQTDRYAIAEHRRLFDATPDLR
ncbi:deoxyguanosinetriphosphate triphosphohydrolase [Methyloceanibacter stevinii]|uniref:Deoxyguanosinetriphosphate triphosphohydrolase-like protein n=1 Tax=Methyloceanibacter stevinii TaxID=1774970 RepID=A0A1E3VMJ2_9HYPH|nr:deoxyguanosinetriphosphate triphosphohydrolase [Methyloceanibacter stevinii]ODR94186.1 deoxyguanosinetriphosphate triphosphohydrolase [Methyloceanibacter stevinii]